MNKTTIAVIAAVLILLFAGLWYVNKSRSEKTEAENEGQVIQPSSSPVLASPSVETSSTDSAMVGSVQEFTVEGSNFKFAPSILTAKKDQPVKITFKSTQGFHDFRIDGLNIGTKQIAVGASEVVTFTPDKVGTFEFYCSVGKHRQMGMKGTLVVQ